MNTGIEKFKLVGSKKCKEILELYPDYKVFWRSGFAYRGAGESELDREGSFRELRQVEGGFHLRMVELDFNQKMSSNLNWAAAVDIEINHSLKELHFNGFSENDLY